MLQFEQVLKRTDNLVIQLEGLAYSQNRNLGLHLLGGITALTAILRNEIPRRPEQERAALTERVTGWETRRDKAFGVVCAEAPVIPPMPDVPQVGPAPMYPGSRITGVLPTL